MSDAKIAQGKVTVSKSLVATFDLLGISSLMLNSTEDNLNKLADSLHEVYGLTTTKLREIMQKHSQACEHNGARQILDRIREAISFNVFSDTIVASMRLDQRYIEEQFSKFDFSVEYENLFRGHAVYIFLRMIETIANILFSSGFPARGCIDIGPMYWEKDLVVGQPYVNALKCADKLEFSGVVFTDDAKKFCDEQVKTIKDPDCEFGSLQLEVPTKGGMLTLPCLNWIYNDMDFSKQSTDLRQLLVERFSEHGKTMSASVWDKLENTERTIRAFMIQNKSLS